MTLFGTGFASSPPPHPNEYGEIDHRLANNILRERVRGRKLSTRDEVAFALYRVSGYGYTGEAMLTLWVKQRPSFIGRVLGRQGTWQLFTFAGYD